MTTIQLTRGQILDLMQLLVDKADELVNNEQVHECHYYLDMHSQLLTLNKVISQRASERQLATLVLAEFTEGDI